MRNALLLVAAAAIVTAGDKDFNGRWNIKVQNEARARVWWLEVTGAGSKKLAGRFVGFPGGDMKPIQDLSIEGGQLRFSNEAVYPVGSDAARAKARRRATYVSRIVDGKLVGTFSVDGQPVYQFTGTRAPVIRDTDDASWKRGQPVELMAGRDLSAWTAMIANKELGWSASDGLTKNVAGANNLVSKEKFWNFELHAEYKLGAHTNGGVGLRGRYEVQILEDHGRTPDTHSHGALYSRIVPAVNASRPAGEWQELDVRFVGRTVTVKLNGQTVIDQKEVEGLTAIAGNADEADAGPFIVQGDHGAVEFRKFTVIPLTR